MAVDPPQSVVPATDGCGTSGNSNRSRNGGDFLLKCIQFSCVSFLNLTFSWNSVHLERSLGDYTLLKGQFGNRSNPPLKSLAGSHLRSSCNSSWPKHELVMHEVQVLHSCKQPSLCWHFKNLSVIPYELDPNILFRNPCCVKVEHESFNHDISALACPPQSQGSCSSTMRSHYGHPP